MILYFLKWALFSSSDYYMTFSKFSLSEQMINSKLSQKALVSVAQCYYHHPVYLKVSVTLKIMCLGWEGKSRRTDEEEDGVDEYDQSALYGLYALH